MQWQLYSLSPQGTYCLCQVLLGSYHSRGLTLFARNHICFASFQSLLFFSAVPAVPSMTPTRVKVSFYFSRNLLIAYPHDGKISTAPGKAVCNPQQCLTHMHIWLQVGSHWSLLVVIPSTVLFTAPFLHFA